MAIDAIGIRLNQHTLSVGTHRIAINALQLVALDLRHIKQHTHFLTRAKRILYHTTCIWTQLGIRLTVRQSLHDSH